MIFAIQCSRPATQPPEPRKVEDLAQAIQAIYPMDTEDAILVWNHIPIRLSYKYDVSVMIDDLIPLLEAVLGEAHGEFTVHWGSDSFNAEWMLRWNNKDMRIESDWQSALGNYEELLNSRATLEVSYDSFLAEWKMLLTRIRIDVESARLKMASGAKLDRLRVIEQAIPRYGQLYAAASAE